MARLSRQSAAPSYPAQRRRRWRYLRRSIVPWLFVLPVLLLHGLVIVGPSISGLYYSLTKWSGIGPAEFIGLENFRRLNPEADSNAAHAALARFLFRNTDALKLAGSLSGGERLRAALACVLMSAKPPQLLILDEPTNHLDLDSIAAIEGALAGYDGALLVVSHDPAFLEAIGIEREILLPQRKKELRRSD